MTTIESSKKNQVRISASFARRLIARCIPAVAGATLIVSTFGMSSSALAASYCDTTYCYSTGSGGGWQPLPL
jgi:hypothetical protein